MVRAEKEEWKASPSRGFAGMRADEVPCAIATRALPGASSMRRRGVEGRGGTRRHGACGGRSLSRERRPEAAPAAAKRVVEMPRTLKDNEELPACRLRKRRAPLNERGFEGGAAPSELAKGVQGETAAIGRVSLHPFLYAAPRAAGRGR